MSDPEKIDRTQSILDDLKTPNKDAKLLEVAEDLKIIPQTEITLIPSGKSTMTGDLVYHYFAVGGYADIYKATMASADGRERVVVVKIFREAHLNTETTEQQEVYKNRLRREYGVWGVLNHRNILRLEGLAILDALPSPGLVSEYKPLGDLARFMKANHIFDRLHMAREIVCGLEYLHRNHVVHGDLTPLNILVDRDSTTGLFYALITDFGKSRVLEKDGYTTKVDKTPLIARPPELLEYSEEGPATNKSVLTTASDVYSTSLLILQLITGKEPYSQEKLAHFKLAARIIDEHEPLRPVPEIYPVLDPSYEFCWPLMRACWKTERYERIPSCDVYTWLCTGLPPPHLAPLN